jgi:hypothetical protein
MKLRIEKGSIKARLTEEEVAELISQKILKEEFYFSDTCRFDFLIRIQRQTETVKVSFIDTELVISVREAAAEKWSNTKMIGIREEMQNPLGEKVNIVVEKDLPPRKK